MTNPLPFDVVVAAGDPPSQNAARHPGLGMLRALFQAAAIAGLAGTLAACGGGGGDGGTPTPVPPPPPPPQPLPAVMSVPTPVGYDADKLAAFNRLNELRVAAGLGMLTQDIRLDQAAQAHVEWEIANDVDSHFETVGSPGFTGVNWQDRDRKQGYAPRGGSEVMSTGSGPSYAVDGLLNVIYHRAALLEFDPVDVGIGWSSPGHANLPTPLVIDFASPDDGSARSVGQTAQAQIGGVVVWPLDGATGLPTHMGEEVPNPVPGEDVRLLGTPASISVYKDQKIETSAFSLSEDASGQSVPAVLLDSANDPEHIISQSFVGLLPIAALKENTVYRIDFEGLISPPGALTGSIYTRTWRFTTGDLAYPPQN
jgi:uncharacterized protein YkwD